MSSRDVLIDVSARRVLRQITATERSEFDKIFLDIANSPNADDHRKFSSARGDFLFNDGQRWVLYSLLNDFTVIIHGIGTN